MPRPVLRPASCSALAALVLHALLALLALAAAGCSGDGGERRQPPPPMVEVDEVHKADLPITFSYSGRTQGVRDIEVRARTGGILLERKYVEGAFVEQGDLLFTIDPEKNDANLSQMLGELARNRATLENARRERDRITRLYSEGAVSASERDNAVTAYEAALANVQQSAAKVNEARISRNYNEVRAPISGVTSEESLSEGSLVDTSTALTTITQLDPFYVTFAIPGPEELRNRRWRSEGLLEVPEGGYELQLTLVDDSAYPHPGRINFRDRRVNPQTGAVMVRGEFPNPDLLVLPGQYVRVSLAGAKLKSVLSVPQSSVLFTQKGPVVYVLDEKNTAAMHQVKLGIEVGERFVVLDGVKAGERIVADGVNKIRPGAPVMPKSEADKGKGADAGTDADNATTAGKN